MTDNKQPRRAKPTRKDVPRLRQGVMKRGNTWSYVIRVKDPETGVTKPRWVGGFATEEAAKAARDESRVKARRGEYVDRNRIAVTAYLDDWIGSHAMEIKPRTLQDHRACLRLYVTPRIGHLQVQSVRPSTITKLYRDLLTSGGRDGQPLAVAVAAYTGARRGELLNLDLDGKKITITGSTAVIAGERVNGTTKSGRARVVTIDDETVAMLRQHKADQTADQLHAGDSWRGVRDGYVFTTG